MYLFWISISISSLKSTTTVRVVLSAGMHQVVFKINLYVTKKKKCIIISYKRAVYSILLKLSFTDVQSSVNTELNQFTE